MHAVAVHLELIRTLLVEERVEQDRHAVIAADLLAVGPVHAHDLGPGVVGVEGEVEGIAVIRDPHLGRLRAGRALHRRNLDEVRDVGGRFPDRVVEPAVDLRRRGRAPDGGHRTILASRCESAAARCVAGGIPARRRSAAAGPPEGQRARDVALGPGLGFTRGSRESRGERRGDLVLDVEEVAERAVDPGAEPDPAARDVHDPRRDAELVCHPLQRAIDEPGDPALAIGLERGVRLRRSALSVAVAVAVTGAHPLDQAVSDDGQSGTPQVGGYGLGDAGADPVIGRLPAQIGERRDDDRGGRLSRRGTRRGDESHRDGDRREGAQAGGGHAVA